MSIWLKQCTLESKTVRLIPLSIEHRDALLAAEQDGMLSSLWFTSVPNEATIDHYIDIAMQQFHQGESLPFVVFHKQENRIIGSSRLCRGDSKHKRIEIGYTWYSKSYQRTSINTECKLLLLTHAFEKLHVIAVEFRTHWHNHASRNAIAKLGAKQDGVLRNHQIMADGSYRDTVVFSIINAEWPAVKVALQYKLSSCNQA